MTIADVVQILGVSLGMIGAWLNGAPASRPSQRWWSYLIWLISNVFLCAFLVISLGLSGWAMELMYAYYSFTSLRGLRNNPRAESGEAITPRTA